MKLIAPAPGTRLAALKHEYTFKPLLSEVERQFFACLEQISGRRCHLVVKPRLADFVQHYDGFASLNPIGQKHVDFLVCRHGDWMPMLGIELDDSTHNRKDRRESDCFKNNLFAHIGIPLLRVNVWEVKNVQRLVERLSEGWERRCLRLAAVGG
jgi:very-short-patch-repair endonuclease